MIKNIPGGMYTFLYTREFALRFPSDWDMLHTIKILPLRNKPEEEINGWDT
jgi:hypothetical protein